MKALFFSSDKQLFKADSDTLDRMLAYAELLDGLFIIVFCELTESKNIGKTRLYPTGRKSKIVNFFIGLLMGRKLAKREKIDIVVAQDPLFTGFAGWLVARFVGAKLLVSSYGINVFDKYWKTAAWKNRFLKFLGLFIFSQSDAIQADGFESVEDLRRRYGEKVFWKPMIPRNIDHFKTIARNIDPNEFKILFIGRMVNQKNIPLLVEVIDRLAKKRFAKKVCFTVIGDGPEKEFFDSEIVKRHLTGNVCLIKSCDRCEMPGIYSSHDALLMTSYYEGFPRVFMEAAAAGLPIVTTRVGGVANVIKEGESGFIVEPGDSNGLIAKLESLITDPSLVEKFSRKIREDFWQTYKFEITAETQKKIFDYLSGVLLNHIS